jgi:hypothetical protein
MALCLLSEAASANARRDQGRDSSPRRGPLSRRKISLDDVDLGRKIAGDLKADRLLSNLRLVPDLHGVLHFFG